jgi:hypothetical protein
MVSLQICAKGYQTCKVFHFSYQISLLLSVYYFFLSFYYVIYIYIYNSFKGCSVVYGVNEGYSSKLCLGCLNPLNRNTITRISRLLLNYFFFLLTRVFFFTFLLFLLLFYYYYYYYYFVDVKTTCVHSIMLLWSVIVQLINL